MSLRVWLPLNGDLRNNGLEDVSITNGGATLNNTGKIGQCYYFDPSGSGSYLTIDNYEFLKTFSEFSFACWLKIKTWNTNYSTIFAIKKSTDCSWNNLVFSFLRNGNSSKLCFTITNGTNYSSTSCMTNDLELNVWYHFVCVYKLGSIKIYQNGVLISEYLTNIIPAFSSIKNFWIGKSNITTYQSDTYMNDIRIYDHALSLKEVKEISKGLVLHYPLDDKYLESTVNLCNGLKQGGRTIVSNNTITNTGEDADTYWYIIPKLAVIGGETYTVSCKLTGFSSDDLYIRWGVGAQSGTNCAGYWDTYNGYNEFTFTMPAGLDGSTANIIFDDIGGGSTRTLVFTISDIQLEKKDHATPYTSTSRNETTVYDCSGYLNNSTINNIKCSIDTPKYEVSSLFNGVSSGIQGESFTSLIKSISFWVYFNNLDNQVVFTDYKSKMAFGIYNSYIPVGCTSSGYNITYNKSILSINTWYHIVLIKDLINNQTLLYLNGIKQNKGTTTDRWTSNIFDELRIGVRGNNTTFLNGKLSDFRMYVTALSEEDIKLLYKTKASVDKLQSFYTGKIIEDYNKKSISKTYLSSFNKYILFASINPNIIPNSVTMALGGANASTGTWRVAGTSNMTRTRLEILNSPIGKCYGFQNEGIQTANDGSCYGIDSFPLAANTQYTISMWARIIDGTEGYVGYNIYQLSSLDGGTHNGTIIKNYRVTKLPSNGDWMRCWYTFTTNSNTTRNIYIGVCTGELSVTTQMCAIKIEEGNISTPWIPKKEDLNYNEYTKNIVSINKQLGIYANSFIEI